MKSICGLLFLKLVLISVKALDFYSTFERIIAKCAQDSSKAKATHYLLQRSKFGRANLFVSANHRPCYFGARRPFKSASNTFCEIYNFSSGLFFTGQQLCVENGT